MRDSINLRIQFLTRYLFEYRDGGQLSSMSNRYKVFIENEIIDLNAKYGYVVGEVVKVIDGPFNSFDQYLES